MRGCVSVLVLASLFVVAGSWFGGPALASVLVGVALDGAGFEAQNTRIDVVADPPIEVLGGTVDRVVIGADDATLGDLEAGRVDITVYGVDLVTRRFATMEGRLDDVLLRTADGGATRASRIDLAGEQASVRATVHLPATTIADLVAEALRDQLGFSVGTTTLEAPARVVFTAGPARISARLLIESDGGLWLLLDAPANPRVELLAPGAPLTFHEVLVGEEVLLVGTVDLGEGIPR